MATLTVEPEAPAPVQVSLIAPGDPGIIGLPIFAAGSVCLGLALVGYVPAAAVGGVLPIVLAATGIGLVIATIGHARRSRVPARPAAHKVSRS
jgi:hypothetical protein